MTTGPCDETPREFEVFKNLVIKRRTVKDFDGRAVPENTLRQLVELAQWAPNHHLNAPWFFRIFTQPAIRDWMRYLDQTCSATDKALLAKSMEKLSKVGALIHVTSKREEDTKLHQENYAAVSAAIQTILLGATALNIQSFWSTSKMATMPETQLFLGVTPSEETVGALWLGYGPVPPARARIPLAERSLWIHERTHENIG